MHLLCICSHLAVTAHSVSLSYCTLHEQYFTIFSFRSIHSGVSPLFNADKIILALVSFEHSWKSFFQGLWHTVSFERWIFQHPSFCERYISDKEVMQATFVIRTWWIACLWSHTTTTTVNEYVHWSGWNRVHRIRFQVVEQTWSGQI